MVAKSVRALEAAEDGVVAAFELVLTLLCSLSLVTFWTSGLELGQYF